MTPEQALLRGRAGDAGRAAAAVEDKDLREGVQQKKRRVAAFQGCIAE